MSVIYDSKEETCCVSFGIFVKLHDNRDAEEMLI